MTHYQSWIQVTWPNLAYLKDDMTRHQSWTYGKFSYCGLSEGWHMTRDQPWTRVNSLKLVYLNTHNCSHWSGSRDSSVIRVSDSWSKSPSRSSGKIFFSMVSFLCRLLFQYPFHPGVTAVVHKRSRSFCLILTDIPDWYCAGGRLQLNTRTPCLCGFEWSDTVTWCMVEWCTENLHQNGSISRGTSHATPKERYLYTTSVDINNTGYRKGYSDSFRITCQYAQWVCSRAENSAV